MKRVFFIVGFLLAVVGFFEFYPVIEHGRNIIPEHIYADLSCNCSCILESRPWYSTFNYWFWFWILFVPILVFAVKPNDPLKQKILHTGIAIAVCYGGMIMAIQLMWDIRNGPFMAVSDYPEQKTWDLGCANVADGASLVFTALFGWALASIYTGWWLIAWNLFHKKVTRKITSTYKQDWFHKIIMWLSILAPILFGLWVIYLRSVA